MDDDFKEIMTLGVDALIEQAMQMNDKLSALIVAVQLQNRKTKME